VVWVRDLILGPLVRARVLAVETLTVPVGGATRPNSVVLLWAWLAWMTARK